MISRPSVKKNDIPPIMCQQSITHFFSLHGPINNPASLQTVNLLQRRSSTFPHCRTHDASTELLSLSNRTTFGLQGQTIYARLLKGDISKVTPQNRPLLLIPQKPELVLCQNVVQHFFTQLQELWVVMWVPDLQNDFTQVLLVNIYTSWLWNVLQDNPPHTKPLPPYPSYRLLFWWSDIKKGSLTNSAVFSVVTSTGAVTLVTGQAHPHTYPPVLAGVVAAGVSCGEGTQHTFHTVAQNWSNSLNNKKKLVYTHTLN